MKKLIIFDLDGTLLDTIEDLANSVNYTLALHGYPTHPVPDYRFFIGNGVNNLLLRSLPATAQNVETAAKLKPDFLKHYFAHAEECTRPYPGIMEMMDTLHKKGYKLGVASNKMHDATVQLVQKYFPTIQFSSVFGQREGIAVKPHPAILEEIITIAEVDKEEVLYVGDSGVDATTAVNAKVDFVGVLWGFRPQEELAQAGATQFAENTEELIQLIMK